MKFTPNEDQLAEAIRLEKQWGKRLRNRYLAVCANPKFPTAKIKKSKGTGIKEGTLLLDGFRNGGRLI